LDASVLAYHRRQLTDHYRYLIFDGVSVRIRLVGKVQRRMALSPTESPPPANAS